MLTLGILSNIFTHGLNGFFMLLDSLVYWLISELYDLFYSLASTEFITDKVYEEIANRFLVIIGVVMLFYLAYSLLKALVNPDDLTKGTGKIVTNLIISLILIAIVPSLFTYAFRIQNIIIEDGIIDKIVFGNTNNDLTSVGRRTALTLFESFAQNLPEDAEISHKDFDTWGDLKEAIIANDIEEVSFLDITYATEVIADNPDEASYTPLIGTLCGAFLVYVIFSFCLDMGVRVVKLAFYQIISPIPIMMRIIPEKKSVFDNYVKKVSATYFEVFVRIFIMFIIAFLCSQILTNIINLKGLGLFGKIIVILGIFAFGKQAPKLIGEIIGVDAGNIKLGVRQKLADGGAFVAGGLIGAGATSMVRNLSNKWANKNNWKNAAGNVTAGSVARNLFGGALSGVAGGFSGAARGGYGARSAKNFTDMRNSASKGVTQTIENRNKRESYKANHGGTIKGVLAGHIADSGLGIKNWATGGAASILRKTKFEEEFKNSYKEYEAIYENPNYNAMKNQLQKYEALKASGVTTYEGQSVAAAIDQLKGNMLKSRMDSIRNNSQSAAYAMYNIAQIAKQNPEYAKDIGIDVSMVENLKLKGNQIIDKSTNRIVEADDLYKMIEGSSLRNVEYDTLSGQYIDSISGTVVDFTHTAASQTKDGMSHQKKKASDQLRRDQMSVEYKEAQKRQEANNNK